MMQKLFSAARIPMLALALAATMPAISFAQTAPGRPGARQDRAEARPRAQRLQQVLDQLDLSSDQKAKLQPILDDSRKQIQGIMQGTSDPGQRREQLRAAMADTRKKIGDILTPEQKTKMAELLRQQRAAAATQPAAQGAAGGGMITRLENAALSLDLTPEQRTKVQDLSKEYRDEVATLLRDPTATPGAGQQMRAAVQEYRSRLTQLLTPEQTEQFNKKIAELPAGRNAAGGETRQRGGNRRTARAK